MCFIKPTYHQSSNQDLSKSLNIQPHHQPLSVNWYRSTILTISPSTQSGKSIIPFKFLPTKRTFSSLSCRFTSSVRSFCCSRSRVQCKPEASCSFLSQLVTELYMKTWGRQTGDTAAGVTILGTWPPALNTCSCQQNMRRSNLLYAIST